MQNRAFCFEFVRFGALPTAAICRRHKSNNLFSQPARLLKLSGWLLFEKRPGESEEIFLFAFVTDTVL